MAKKSNVHPDYYKTADREPVGQNTVHEDHKRELTSAAMTESSTFSFGETRQAKNQSSCRSDGVAEDWRRS